MNDSLQLSDPAPGFITLHLLNGSVAINVRLRDISTYQQGTAVTLISLTNGKEISVTEKADVITDALKAEATR